MKLKSKEEQKVDIKPGCSKNGHILHVFICLSIFIVFIFESNSNPSGFGILALLYATFGTFYSTFRVFQLSKIEKEEAIAKQIRELDSTILRFAKENGGFLTPSILSMQASISIEEARKILESYVERGISRLEVTDEGVLKYVFPELLTDKSN